MASFISRLSFNAKVRASVWKQLGKLLENRMRLADALALLKEQAERRKSPRALVYAEILRKLGSGHTLGEALEVGYASREEILLISFAQDSSRLAGGLTLAGKVLEARGKILKSLVNVLSYPVMLFTLVIVMMIIVAEKVMPHLLLLSDPNTWSGAAYILYRQSSFVASLEGLIFGLVLLALAVLTGFSFARWTGPGRRVADKIMPWSIYRLTVGTLWLYALATRMSAGHQISGILREMVSDPGTSPYLREIMERVLAFSSKGEDLGQALKNSEMSFPSVELVDTLAVYARMPDFQKHIVELADGWLADGIEGIERLVGKLRFWMLILVILQLCLVALAIGNFQTQFQGGRTWAAFLTSWAAYS